MQIPDHEALLSAIATVTPSTFEAVAADVWLYQAHHNAVYARYLDLLAYPRCPSAFRLDSLPFLPISCFKTQDVRTGDWPPQLTYTSSSTTGQIPSRHAVRDTAFYLENARRCFAVHYGEPSDWCVLALLPSYLERQGSSLVAMAEDFIRRSRYAESGFFLHDFERLREVLTQCRQRGTPTLLLGVSFALLDLAEQHPMDLSGVVVMETGGMKGRRRELTRAELHERLRQAFGVEAIHSEYGMTELLSQAYAVGGPLFSPAPTLHAYAREINDPFCPVPPGRTGLLHLIDLAN
ncbi:MAG TPA: acyl transferase, partial [Saprospiraceae bacterium]|nr:acyl transferase [Saprospiraceae bacterium]